MLDKLDHYDILGIVIPGVLLAYWLPICFPQTVEMAAAAGFPEAVDIVGFAAIAIFLGQLIQAAASALEPLLFVTWGGTPSDRALDRGLAWLGKEYLSAGAAQRIKARLSPIASDDASNQDLFDIALTRANGAPGSRTERFNALYAYHRALVFVVALALLLLVTSRLWGAAETWSAARFWVVLAVLAIILAFMWHRAKQRAFYYVREALRVAELTIDRPAVAASPARQED